MPAVTFASEKKTLSRQEKRIGCPAACGPCRTTRRPADTCAPWCARLLRGPRAVLGPVRHGPRTSEALAVPGTRAVLCSGPPVRGSFSRFQRNDRPSFPRLGTPHFGDPSYCPRPPSLNVSPSVSRESVRWKQPMWVRLLSNKFHTRSDGAGELSVCISALQILVP